MKCQLIDFSSSSSSGKPSFSDFTLPEFIFEEKVREDIMSRVVHWQLAKRRSGTHSTKIMSDVAYSTRKLYAQKGTGRARHGSKKANIFVGGGVTFGPLPRSHKYKLPRKIKVAGIRSAVTMKVLAGKFFVMKDFEFEIAKTAELKSKLKLYDLDSVLFVDIDMVKDLRAASSNLGSVLFLPFIGLNVYDILRHDKLVFTLDALDYLENKILGVFAC